MDSTRSQVPVRNISIAQLWLSYHLAYLMDQHWLSIVVYTYFTVEKKPIIWVRYSEIAELLLADSHFEKAEDVPPWATLQDNSTVLWFRDESAPYAQIVRIITGLLEPKHFKVVNKGSSLNLY